MDQYRSSSDMVSTQTLSTVGALSLEDLKHSEKPASVFSTSVESIQDKSRDNLDSGDAEIFHPGRTLACCVNLETSLQRFYQRYHRHFKILFWMTVLLGYNGGLIYACVRNFQKAKTLFILTMVVYCCIVYCNFISEPLWRRVGVASGPFRKFLRKHRRNRRRIQAILFFVAVAIFLGIDCASNPQRLQSLVGIFGIILFGWLISKYPAQVPWYTVLWGIAIQVIFALIILRWEAGRSVFDWLGGLFEGLIEFTDAGSEFVFGKNFRDHFFAFAVMPVVVFFGFIIAALYYWGAMQFLIMKMGWLLEAVLGTSACESFCAAANIFVGMTEAPLMVKPYLERMTASELHALFVGGFANVAGSVLAAYISFGVSAVHLLSASVMSAPCSLALSKLVYPETERTRTSFDQITFERGPEHNILEAATIGATSTVKLVSYIVANIISCLAAIKLFNYLLNYFGNLVGLENLSFQLLAGYIFMPLAWAMGADWVDCDDVGQLVGIKTILNEFIAYVELGDMIKNQTISVKSQLVATYALCGFSNIASLGIMIGGMTAMAPGRKREIVDVGIRSLITGSLSCFFVASLAALLVDTSLETYNAKPILLSMTATTSKA
ncbi:Solute carrier family 28 member 3 [Hypsibius exemplaris]|uniref:Solute carrier family 28 member 3 n=1 Tax=Hypsibius exemplaris TaxID=2072580 RepID=A0A1W0WMD2_HYPEX|nr:Solute carrier family 28 member 3 [Hypsibius exemplaris]